MALLRPTILPTPEGGNILLIEFSDPGSRNSFSFRAAEELIQICESRKSQYGAVIFRARGRVFCSGGNLADYAAHSDSSAGRDINRRISEVLDWFSALPVPTICIVNGDCFGGGLELTSAFDEILAVPHALFGFWQRKIGLTFGWGGGARLERRLGRQMLRRLALSVATFGSAEALRIGMIDGVCLETLILDRAQQRARELMAGPQGPIAAMKSWVVEEERQTFEGLWWSDEHRSVLNVWRSKQGKNQKK